MAKRKSEPNEVPAKSVKKKLKKSKDANRCCRVCASYDGRNPEKPKCSLTGDVVEPDGICGKCDTTLYKKCDRCGKPIKYTDRDKYYDSFVTFEMKHGSESSGKNFHLCKSCASNAWDKFQDFLDNASRL